MMSNGIRSLFREYVCRKSYTNAREPSKEILEHLKIREGVMNVSYLDSLQKLTGGIGHLLNTQESLVYPEGTYLPQDQIDEWFEKDVEGALLAAQKQATQIKMPELEDALVHVNFQLGTNWIKKFPKAWNCMGCHKWDDAITEVALNSKGDGPSRWAKQTPVRVSDFVGALKKVRDKGDEYGGV